MTTAREREIQGLRGFGLYGAHARTGKIGELWQIQRDAEQARQDTATKSREAAEERAAEMLKSAGYSQAAAAKRVALQKANLAESQTRTKAATDYAKQRLDPWYEAGTDALGKLQTKIDEGPGDMKKSPGYQFRLDEGQKAIERGAAARGGVLSGAAVKEGMRYGQNFATNDYDNFLRRYYESMQPLERMSGQGMQAGIQQGNFGMQGAQQYAQLGQAATNQMAAAARYGGDSQAEGTMNAANIMAAQQAAVNERNYGYAAWKGGEDF